MKIGVLRQQGRQDLEQEQGRKQNLEFIRFLQASKMALLAQMVCLGPGILEDHIALLVRREFPRLDDDDVVLAHPQVPFHPARDLTVTLLAVCALDDHA